MSDQEENDLRAQIDALTTQLLNEERAHQVTRAQLADLQRKVNAVRRTFIYELGG